MYCTGTAGLVYNKSLPRHLKWSNTNSTFSVEASQDEVDALPKELDGEEFRDMCKRVFSSVGLGLRTGSPRTTS